MGGRDRLRRIGRAALRFAAVPFLYPYLWAWPVAMWWMYASYSYPVVPYLKLQRYWLPALVMLLVGCPPSAFARRRRVAAPTFLSPRLLTFATIALLLAATFLRVWKIAEWPPEGIGFEEFQLGARGNLSGNWLQDFIRLYAAPGEHTLSVYAVSIGNTIVGTGFLGMRLVFMLAGIACPFLFYALCRRLVSWEVSLFALGLFAVSWWQIAASRVADEIFFPIWAELAILWLLLQFEDTASAWAAFFLALLSGLLVYEYTSYHLVLVIVAGYLTARLLLFAAAAIGAALRRRSPERRPLATIRAYAPGAIVIVLVWVIVAHFQVLGEIRQGMGSWLAGGVGGHAADPDGLLVVMRTPSALPAFLVRKLSIPFLASFQGGHGLHCRFTGLGVYPAFDHATAAAIGLGLVLLAATFWRRFHALTLVWAGAVIAGAALLPEQPNLHRYYTGLPFYYLAIALGAEVVWQSVRARRGRYALLAIFAVAFLYAAVFNVRLLFWKVIPDPAYALAWHFPRTEVASWIRGRRRDEWICVVATSDPGPYGPSPENWEYVYLIRGWNVRISPTGADCIPAPPDAKGPLYYVVSTPEPPVEASSVVETLRRTYPDAQELAPIEAPMYDFSARAFRVASR